MNKIKTKTVGRVTAAAALSLGFAASAVSVASASTHGSRHGGHRGFADGTNWTKGLGGVVTSVTATSVTVTAHDGTSSTFTITPTTTFAEGSTTVLPAVLVVGDRIEIQVASSATSTATSIDIDLARFGGEVTVVSGDTITISGHDGVSSTILVGTTTTFSKGGATAALTDVAAGLYVSAQGVIGATPTTLDASSFTIGAQCDSSGAGHGDNHSDSNSRSEGNDQGNLGNQDSHGHVSHGQGFGGRGSSHHANWRR